MEVSLREVEHDGAQVVLAGQLSDEHVVADGVAHVGQPLDLAQDVREPLELLLAARHPHEDGLLRVDGLVHGELGQLVGEVFEDGGEGRDANATAHEDDHVVRPPALVPLAEGPVNVDLRVVRRP